ncbi:hypothetical protein AB4Y36_22215 [Paraburkholderia sp. BR10936]|uniref:hypothetical protein n=1 Tax=Paraburkholderia sp. BR10936 TaxID=3236993 RepID=UPI0034D22DB5
MSSSPEFSAAVLARTSRQATLITVAGIAIVVATFAFSTYRLYSLEKEVNATKKEVRELLATRQSLQQDVEVQRSEYKRQQAILDRVSLQLGKGDAVAATKTLESHAEALGPAPISPRVYVQVRSDAQMALYGKLADTLRTRQYEVPPPELVAKGPNSTEVRYFRATDAKLARDLAANVETVIAGTVRVQYIAGYEHSPLVKPHQFEIWFAP